MPVDWVDGVTWVNAANLEIMEADIAEKQPTSQKGAVNGYAPLDSGAKVPLVNLPPVSGVDYIGTWGSGIAYKKGDVVKYGSYDYMAVNDSTGVTPPAVATPAVVPISYGTTLPAAPFDGQEAVLVDNVGNPTYLWRFRYNGASLSAYKWEFVGGVPQRASFTGTPLQLGIGVTGWQDAAGVPTITLARAGDYDVTFFAGSLGNSGGYAGAYDAYCGVLVGAALSFATVTVVGAYNGAPIYHTSRFTSVAAATIAKLGWQQTAANATSRLIGTMGLLVVPARVA